MRPITVRAGATSAINVFFEFVRARIGRRQFSLRAEFRSPRSKRSVGLASGRDESPIWQDAAFAMPSGRNGSQRVDRFAGTDEI